MEFGQIVATLIHSVWSWIGILLLVFLVVIVLAVHRRRKRGLVQGVMQVGDAKVIFRDQPHVEEVCAQQEEILRKKICHSCGAIVPREDLICWKCEMPAMYGK
jgi:ribosomal protein L40E